MVKTTNRLCGRAGQVPIGGQMLATFSMNEVFRCGIHALIVPPTNDQGMSVVASVRHFAFLQLKPCFRYPPHVITCRCLPPIHSYAMPVEFGTAPAYSATANEHKDAAGS